ncbi:type III secretion system export apparatus subunit SctT [Advenella incenata]
MDALGNIASSGWIQAWFDIAYPAITATSLAMSRCLGMVFISPVFNRLGMTGLLRTGVALVFALPTVPMLLTVVINDVPQSAFLFVGMLCVEMLVGMLLGAIYGIPVWAAEAAGELIDLQRGSTMSQLLDPLSATESSVTATLFSIVILALFFLSGGLLLLLQGIYDSYAIWPVGQLYPVFHQGMGVTLLSLLDRVLELAVLMVAPLMVAILVADLLLAYLSRMAPSLHVFDLSMPVKNLLFAVLIVLYVSFLIPNMVDSLVDTFELSDWLDLMSGYM